MIKETYIEQESFYGCLTKSLLLTHDPKSNSLVVLFPGNKYPVDMPILYYANMATLLKGCDVLGLEYGFYRANKAFAFEDFDKVVNEITKIINMVTLKSYSRVYFISKSLGTLFAGEISNQMVAYDIKNLFLTPIEKTVPYMINTNCISVTGSNDKAFPISCLDFVINKTKSEIIVIDDANHSLETDTSTSVNLEILKRIVKICEDFVF